MTILLQNQNIRLDIDHPGQIYRGSRFDWTGQITQITYQNRYTFCTTETETPGLLANSGRGLYNEFGMDGALGFADCPVAGQFHKIGVGLLTRPDEEDYRFNRDYPVQPVDTTVDVDDPDGQTVVFTVSSPCAGAYSFQLVKTISLMPDGFRIHYRLTNTGERLIDTTEYVHNFLSIQGHALDPNYHLKFSFPMDSRLFEEYVNTGSIVSLDADSMTWLGTPTTPFFFSRINATHPSAPLSAPVSTPSPTFWELSYTTEPVVLREIVDFEVHKINVWGTRHVVSPEIFYRIYLHPGQTGEWVRTYQITLS